MEKYLYILNEKKHVIWRYLFIIIIIIIIIIFVILFFIFCRMAPGKSTKKTAILQQNIFCVYSLKLSYSMKWWS